MIFSDTGKTSLLVRVQVLLLDRDTVIVTSAGFMFPKSLGLVWLLCSPQRPGFSAVLNTCLPYWDPIWPFQLWPYILFPENRKKRKGKAG